MEQLSLASLGVVGEWIWGDDAETTVFAQAFGINRTIIFRFIADNSHPDSLPSRIVNCYHDRNISQPQETFPGLVAMRAALWSAVAAIWLDCARLDATSQPDTIINVTEDGSWEVVTDYLLADYLSLLPEPSDFAAQGLTKTVAFQNLTRLQQLGGRGCTTLVHDSSTPEAKMVFKGVDFRTFLFTYESGLVKEEITSFKRSIELLCHMPPHPYILPAPQILVTMTDRERKCEYVCGCLYPFYTNGNLADKIEESNGTGVRIPLPLKAKWCYQMTAAIAHTHYEAKTFHMDIKPGNFILDDNSNVVLVDWEQNDAPVTTAAPEMDGTWDAQEMSERLPDGSTTTRVLYSKYQGPPRRNMPEETPGSNGWNVWNSLLHWQKTCPKAAELAEVFSLGRTMWMLLSQYRSEDLDDVESTEDVVEDWSGSDTIPASYKTLVGSCLERDPTKRPALEQVERFWATALQDLEKQSR
ncbi:kinase-like domain [Cordyceps militaris]|uniref:Kinase-like domain n=1 Tax=Cordyceps militaris TaxID=73501 RepID=A0A2H4SF79_CORMI|nr:kinase-like domain [Cordyceps militaris]